MIDVVRKELEGFLPCRRTDLLGVPVEKLVVSRDGKIYLAFRECISFK